MSYKNRETVGDLHTSTRPTLHPWNESPLGSLNWGSQRTPKANSIDSKLDAAINGKHHIPPVETLDSLNSVKTYDGFGGQANGNSTIPKSHNWIFRNGLTKRFILTRQVASEKQNRFTENDRGRNIRPCSALQSLSSMQKQRKNEALECYKQATDLNRTIPRSIATSAIYTETLANFNKHCNSH